MKGVQFFAVLVTAVFGFHSESFAKDASPSVPQCKSGTYIMKFTSNSPLDSIKNILEDAQFVAIKVEPKSDTSPASVRFRRSKSDNADINAAQDAALEELASSKGLGCDAPTSGRAITGKTTKEMSSEFTGEGGASHQSTASGAK